jgi:hypothetical protein
VLPLFARLSFFAILTLCGVGETDDTCIIFWFKPRERARPLRVRTQMRRISCSLIKPGRGSCVAAC